MLLPNCESNYMENNCKKITLNVNSNKYIIYHSYTNKGIDDSVCIILHNNIYRNIFDENIKENDDFLLHPKMV